MNEKQLRKSGAELARDIRKIDRQYPGWSIKEWNQQVRKSVQQYMDSVRHFYKVNGDWDETEV